jgi:hypothetical protein
MACAKRRAVKNSEKTQGKRPVRDSVVDENSRAVDGSGQASGARP